MNPLISEFIGLKRIAVVGMSRSGRKYGNYAAKELVSKGYEIFPVHPEAQEIDHLKCYPTLKSLSGKVEALWISVPPQKVTAILEEAAEMGLKNIWLQQGAWSKEVQQTIDRLNLPVVSKKCILMYAQPVKSVHRFHRTIKSVFGGL